MLLAQADVAAFSKVVELALFMDAKLDVAKVPARARISPSGYCPIRMILSSANYLFRERYCATWINFFVRHRTNGVWGPLLRCSPWSRGAKQTIRVAQVATMIWS